MAPTATQKTPRKKREFLSNDDAAAYIGVQPQTMSVWRSTGRYGIPYYKVGRLPKYDLADLDAWLESRKQTQTS